MDKPKGIGAWIYSRHEGKNQSFRQFSNKLKRQATNNVIEAKPSEFPRLEGEELEAFFNSLRASENLFVDVKVNPVNDLAQFIIISWENKKAPLLSVNLEQVTRDQEEVIEDILRSDQEKFFKDGRYCLYHLIKSGFLVKGKIFDINLAAQVLASGKQEEPGYSKVVKKYLKIDIIEDYLCEGLSLDEYIQGTLFDIDLAINVKKVIEEKIEELNLREATELEFSCLPAIANLEVSGIGFDYDKWLQNKEKTIQEKNTLLEKVRSYFPSIDINNDKEVVGALQSEGVAITGLKVKELERFKDYQEVKRILEYKKAVNKEKYLSQDILKYISSSTGRIHPTYHQIGVTGRISCTQPNLQGIPKMREVRECFVPDPDNKFIIADYSQIELRVAAEISKDPVMIKAFKEGKDLHRFTAANIAGKAYEDITEEERQAAKAVNFGLIYAMGTEGLMKYAEESYGVKLTEEQALSFRIGFFSTYEGIKQWQDNINTANNITESRTLSGRRRIWLEEPKITQLYNTPIQGTAADIMKKALAILIGRIEGTWISIVGVVHDEIILEVPDDKIDEVREVLIESMEQGGRHYLKEVPVEVEVRVSESWAE